MFSDPKKKKLKKPRQKKCMYIFIYWLSLLLKVLLSLDAIYFLALSAARPRQPMLY